MTGTSELSCIADVGAVLGEGPVWAESEQALYWVDIGERRLFRWSAAEGVRIVLDDAPICSLMPRASGGFIGAGHEGFLAIDVEQGRLDFLGDPEPDLAANRFNDGKTDREGRFWAGTMDRREREASGSLYRLDADFSWTRIDRGYRVSNGPAFSLDGRTMYHSDSALRTVYAFDVDEAGRASNRRVLAQFAEEEGYPDGMTVDAEGCYWLALIDAWRVGRFDPDGRLMTAVELPVRWPTAPCFGGADLCTLFVTNLRSKRPPEQLQESPDAGTLVRVELDIRGLPDTPARL